MINLKDLYTYYAIVPLTADNNQPLGFTVISYEVRRYLDVRNLSSPLAYQIFCTQRVVIPNATLQIAGFYPNTEQGPPTYSNYPAVLMISVACNVASPAAEIVTYFPRTLNSSVATSISNSSASSNVATMQHTSGSSVSQSNSFGVSAALGMLGEGLTGNLGADFSHAWGTERSKSVTQGSDAGKEHQSVTSDSMSVKDWACNTYYATNGSLTWVWGQEYPWDVVRYGIGSDGQLPAFIQRLLTDGAQALPPSQLSQFGLDFTMKALWILQPGDTPVQFSHSITYYTASHTVNDTGATVSVGTPLDFSYASPPPPLFDVFTLGLDPIANDGPASMAIIGFVPRQFVVQPSPAQVSGTTLTPPTAFQILSASNNLLIQDTSDYSNLTTADNGAGFTPSPTALTAAFTQYCTSLTITLSFKVIDTVNSYKLLMKHWITGATGVMMTITTNFDSTNAIVKFVDALEAEGGEKNLLSISLRDLNYGSVDYHDYLNLGFNSIAITFTPIGGNFVGCGYQIRAISIEKE